MEDKNRLIPDIRPENIQTFTETSGGGQTATYKILEAHPILNGILDKPAFIRTHAAAVWYNRQDNRTVKDEIDGINDRLAYQDIEDQVTVLDSSAASVISAYTENGTVSITLLLKAGVHGSIQVAQINTQFAPRALVGGAYVCLSSASDQQKIPSLYINELGKIMIWFTGDLLYNERGTFVYPLRG